MPDFLKFINELTVNGKPVEEDELEDDYTSNEEEDEESKEGENLDLSVGDGNDPAPKEDEEEPVDDDDYTVEPEDATDDEPPANDNGDLATADSGEEDAGGLDLSVGNGEEPPADNTDVDTQSSEPAGDDAGGETGTEEPPAADANGDDPGDGSEGDTSTEPAGDDGSLDMGDSTGDDGDDDYTGGGGDDPGTDDTGDDPGTSDDMGDDTSDEESEGENELEAKIKQTEAEIFNSLSEEEKTIRNTELIEDFIAMKNVIKIFLEKVRTITLTEANTSILQFIEVSLVDLGNMINDYLIERFVKKTYIENFITYQHMVLTIRQLKDIVSKVDVDENPKK